MRVTGLCLFALLFTGTAFAAELSDCAALGIKLPPVLTGCEISGGVVHLQAGRGYLKQDVAQRERELTEILQTLKISASTAPVSVEFGGGGEMWTLNAAGHADMLDNWSDRNISVGEKIQKHGRLFGYLGGQLMRGGDYPSQGFMARLGTTFFRNRYDASIGYSHSSDSGDSSASYNTFDINGRVLFHYSRQWGFNAGGQLNRSSSGDSSSWTPALLGGINIYAPSGSFDTTLTYGKNGNRTITLGYSVFFMRK